MSSLCECCVGKKIRFNPFFVELVVFTALSIAPLWPFADVLGAV
jgi:hypothetical protein